MITCDKCAYCSPTPGGSLYCALTDHFVPNLGCEHGEPINKPKTNADRIRAMNDEELSIWLAKFTDCGECPVSASHCNASEESCACLWHEWLKKEGDRMSVSKWAYSPLMCDGIVCAGDCDYCGNRERAEAFKTLQTDYEVCRNELCLRCGDYKMAHKGACDDCRWRR